jgi:hypothetical protein
VPPWLSNSSVIEITLPEPEVIYAIKLGKLSLVEPTGTTTPLAATASKESETFLAIRVIWVAILIYVLLLIR